MSTPIPRTSSAIIASGFQAVPEGFRAFAGILERELTALTTERDELRAALALGQINCDAEYDDLRDERDAARACAERAEAEVERLGHLEAVLRSSAADMTAGSITAGGVADLRAENERLRRAYVRPDDIRAQLESAIARAERAEADLATERARLDSGQILLTVAGERVWHCGVDLRAAIDAAMNEHAK